MLRIICQPNTSNFGHEVLTFFLTFTTCFLEMQFHSRYWRSSSQINHSKSTENSNKSNSVSTHRPSASTAEVWTFFASITNADKRHNACWAYMRNMQFKVGDFTKFSVASRNIAPLGHLLQQTSFTSLFWRKKNKYDNQIESFLTFKHKNFPCGTSI